jgi:hypothetical protein
VGKENTQKIESNHINLRTRIKRLVRRTICFSKTITMHDLVIGLFINRYEFGLHTTFVQKLSLTYYTHNLPFVQSRLAQPAGQPAIVHHR